MRVRVDLESDALYFRISEEEIEESEEVSPGVITGLRQGWKSSGHRNIGSERLPAKGVG